MGPRRVANIRTPTIAPFQRVTILRDAFWYDDITLTGTQITDPVNKERYE
jgi:hypothetical protein